MDTFSALADPTRREIMELLAKEGALSANDIYAHFSVSPPAVSQHLKVLREANLVVVERRAQQRIYRINSESLHEMEDWARRISRLWNDRFDALDKIIQMEKRKEGYDEQK